MFCYQKSFFNPTLPVDEAQFWALVRATQWNENIDRYRETGDQRLKRSLPAFIFQATFDETTSKKSKVGRWRKQAATRLTGLVVMDVDHVESEELRVRSEEFAAADFPQKAKELGILLIYITPSGHGLKIVFKAREEWGNLIDNQHAMAKLMGVEVDESCKDASRMSFICKEKDILFIDKELFTYENKAFSERYTALYRAGHSSPQQTQAQKLLAPSLQGGQGESLWRGYSIQAIIDARYEDKLPCKEDSNRHTESLKLATDLLLMLDGDRQQTLQVLKAQPWVQEIIAERNEDVEQTVSSAAECVAQKERKFANSLPSKAMLEAVKEATGKTYQEITKSTPTSKAEGNHNAPFSNLNSQLDDWGEQIEALMQDFPLLHEVCEGLPRMQWPAAVFLAGGFLMTLMTRTWYRFYHRPEKKRRLNCSLLVIGDPASGKSVATDLDELLTEPIRMADKQGKDTVNKWKETTEAKGANKDKELKPKVIIRKHPARTSNQTFITDMVNAVEVVDGEEMQLHMLTFDSELDNTMTVQKGGSWINKQAMELKAFHNEEDGQAYSNKGSVQEDFKVTWNFIYTGTPLALKNKVNDANFGTGLPTRLTVIPMPSTNFRMMELQEVSAVNYQRQQTMRQWAFKLDTVKGELPLWPLVKKLWEWTNRRMEDACDNDSKAEEMLLKRCAYHGLNYSAPFIVMRHWDRMHQDGKYWCGTFEVDETDWRLCELLTNIHHACQLHYFMAMAEKYFDNQMQENASNKVHKRKTVEGYNLLPDEFTAEDVMNCFGLNNTHTARSRITRLVNDHLAEKTAEYVENGTTKAKYRKIGTMM